MLRRVAAVAVERWEGMGLTQAERELLHSARFEIADLSPGLLGQLIGTTISIDYSAADYGWFVGTDPDDSSEFGSRISQSEIGANAGGPADLRMDLYTVLLHEIGHLLKFKDTSPDQSIRGVMTAELPTSIRRLPTRWQNPSQILDVNGDGSVSPLDALLVINEVIDAKFRDVSGRLPSIVPEEALRRFYDTNGDGFASALDVLRIINHLNDLHTSAAPEGEAPVSVHRVDLALLDLQSERSVAPFASTAREPVATRTEYSPANLAIVPVMSNNVRAAARPGTESPADDEEFDLALLEWLDQQ
jgi:hypothetical protein